jgi:mono/diheme cytochrome c family protein
VSRIASIVAAVMTFAAPLSAQAPDSISAEVVAEGRKVFEGKAGGALCFSCHGMNARGVAGVGPDLTDGTWLHGDGTLASIEALVLAGVPKPKQSVMAMPPMGGAKLTPQQVRAVAAYVRALNARR